MGIKGLSFDAFLFEIGSLLVMDGREADGTPTYVLRPDIIEWLGSNNVPHIMDIRPGWALEASTITIFDKRLATLFKLTWL